MHTKILIDQFPTEITLKRPPAQVEDGQGGRSRPSTPPTTLAPQEVFVSGLNSNGRSQTAARWDITEQGELFLTRFIIIGMPELNVQEDDWFEFMGRKFYIQNVFPDRTYETKCEAVTLDG